MTIVGLTAELVLVGDNGYRERFGHSDITVLIDHVATEALENALVLAMAVRPTTLPVRVTGMESYAIFVDGVKVWWPDGPRTLEPTEIPATIGPNEVLEVSITLKNLGPTVLTPQDPS